MRRSRVLEKIREGKVARLCSMGHFLPFYPRHAAQFGYDGVMVDGEHRAWDAREVQAMIAFHHLADADCLWRPPTVEKTGLYRLLEDGVSALHALMMIAAFHGGQRGGPVGVKNISSVTLLGK